MGKKSYSAAVLDETARLDTMMAWVLFKQEVAHIWEGGEDEWRPGDSLYQRGEGNYVRPIIQGFVHRLYDSSGPDVPAAQEDETFTGYLFARCSDCLVTWSGDEPCWSCGQELPVMSRLSWDAPYVHYTPPADSEVDEDGYLVWPDEKSGWIDWLAEVSSSPIEDRYSTTSLRMDLVTGMRSVQPLRTGRLNDRVDAATQQLAAYSSVLQYSNVDIETMELAYGGRPRRPAIELGPIMIRMMYDPDRMTQQYEMSTRYGRRLYTANVVVEVEMVATEAAYQGLVNELKRHLIRQIEESL